MYRLSGVLRFRVFCLDEEDLLVDKKDRPPGYPFIRPTRNSTPKKSQVKGCPREYNTRKVDGRERREYVSFCRTVRALSRLSSPRFRPPYPGTTIRASPRSRPPIVISAESGAYD